MTSFDPKPDSPASRRSPAKSSTRIWIIVGVVVLLAVGFLVWRSHHAASSATADAGAGGPAGGSASGAAASGRTGRSGAGAPVPAVGVAAVRSGDINVYLDGLGSVTPRAQVTVHTQVNGQLLSVNFKEGQMVRKGDLLAQIDPRPFEATLEQAQGQLLRDDALLAAARVDLQRYKTLITEDSIAQQTLDTQAALVKQDEGNVKADQGTVDSARVNLAYTRISAPVAGRVGLRQVDAGNLVQTSDTNGIVVITQLQPIDVIFTIPQDSIPQVQKPMQAGQTLPVEAFDRDRKTSLGRGQLLTMDNVIDVTTGTVKLKAAFANEQLALFPNQFVNTNMLVDTIKGATVAPVSAVQRGTIGTYAYLVKSDQTVTVRKITLGATEGDNVVVTAGLVPGDTVVVDGADKLREGAKIEVSPPAGAAPAAAAPAKASGDASKAHRRRATDATGTDHTQAPSADKAAPASGPANAPAK